MTGPAPVRLRRRLFQLVAVGILPVAAMSALGLTALVRQQRRQAETVGRELTRAVATAVWAELRSIQAVLESLSTSPALDEGDDPQFNERARRIVQQQGRWLALTVSSPTGAVLLTTSPDPAAELPADQTVSTVVQTNRAAVGPLVLEPAGHVFHVSIPVFRQGALRYVLTAVISPDLIKDVLDRQQVPSDWVISIFDAQGMRVARSREHQQTLGGHAAPSLQRLMAGGRQEEFGVTTALEGDRFYTGYSRLAESGWSAALGIPASLVDGAVNQSIAVYGGGLVVSVGLGVLVAIWLARRVTRPIERLGEAAGALGRGEPVHAPDSALREIQDVAAALTAAAAERRAGEAQREDLLRKERDARERAEAADRAKDEFLAVLSHELRTPLNAVYGWARLLQGGQLDEDATRRAVEAIVRNTHAQTQLIDDLLDVSRIVTGKLRLNVGRVDLAAVVDEALDAVRPAAEAKEIRIEKHVDADAGQVRGDPVRLQQVVWNLLINAVKFTPKGGRIETRLRRVDAHAEIVVTDTGQGIAPDLLPFVFERFRQSDSSSTRAHGGLGIGLSLARHLVDLHGGSLSAGSAGAGQGATFVVSLPLGGTPASAAALPRSLMPARPGVPPADPVRLDGHRVVAVDDDPEGLALVEAVLRDAGADVRACATADAAFEAVRDWRPDLLISDIEMPAADGYALIARVRALPAGAGGETPAIALTAYRRQQDEIRAKAAGFARHVPKPVDPGELTRIVAATSGRGDG